MSGRVIPSSISRERTYLLAPSRLSIAPALQIRVLHKKFGVFSALSEVDLTVERRHVHGFLGLKAGRESHHHPSSARTVQS